MPQALAPRWAAHKSRYGSIPAPFHVSAGSAGGLPQDPAEIPVCWLTTPLTLRLDRPFNYAEVTQVDGSTARYTAPGATVIYPFFATLTTAVDADASNLAHWTVTYNSTPRMRSPSLTINLLYRTDAEKAFLLGIGRNRRIRLTGLPTGWPQGADTLVVRGIQHRATTYARTITWITGPVIGLSPIVSDAFGRSVSGEWGTPDFGPNYEDLDSGLSVSGGKGVISHAAVNSFIETHIGVNVADFDLYVDVDPTVSTGSGTGAYGVRTRIVSDTSGDDYIDFRIFDNPGSAYSVGVREVINTVQTQFDPAFPTVPGVSAGGVIRLRLQAQGRTARMKAYNPTSAEPSSWLSQLSTLNHVSRGRIAFNSSVPAGWTNVPPIITTYDDLTISAGSNPRGIAGPWFRWGTSYWSGIDTRPF